ncbi:MAG: patatin-like phospholipase family protein [Holosporales bacterium]|jgi:patatin-like phospholipase/acyl hydrolase|nr:patatin-like phospholipase family protein [Holosporales bacterium]
MKKISILAPFLFCHSIFAHGTLSAEQEDRSAGDQSLIAPRMIRHQGSDFGAIRPSLTIAMQTMERHYALSRPRSNSQIARNAQAGSGVVSRVRQIPDNRSDYEPAQDGSSLAPDSISAADAWSVRAEPARQVRIAAFDGGGGRGVIPAYEVTRLEEETRLRFADMFHMVAGTSTGGIIALALTIKSHEDPTRPLHPASEVLSMYTHETKEFFVSKGFSFGGAVKTKYKSKYLYAKLKSIFGDTLFSNSLIHMLIPCYDTERVFPKIFKSFRAAENPLNDFFCRDIARGTSAAPSYFKPARIVSRENTAGEARTHTLIDGGVFANDPAMVAFAEAKRIYPRAEEFVVVSFGTGRSYTPLLYDASQSMRGYNWATAFPDIAIDASAATVDYQMAALASADSSIKYYRFQPTLPSDISRMDDTSDETIRRWIYHAEEETRSPKFHEVARILSEPKTPPEHLLAQAN